jgi:hypothetical protein
MEVVMTNFRSIEIDFDVHKLVENERRSFSESPNDALRRLLKLPHAKAESQSTAERISISRSWNDDEVKLEHGTALRMVYNKRTYNGQIIDGAWVVEGRKFDSPSGAASGIALTKKGKSTKLDGWKYWYVKFPGTDTWTLLDDLRPKIAEVTLSDLGL